ncbi:hypothetical protein FIBSPDRAFT_903886 [Athelia psychrophila]|uniref:Uncharacterized protein n=1 Tax=Athelia psychrophila TaxID=1759441 RepID=A0A167VFI9_9AGAM|nr:hypothetical protein FIBSPDRAFT_903886 [Fibularhizoctonia sp. CBS 109695]
MGAELKLLQTVSVTDGVTKPGGCLYITIEDKGCTPGPAQGLIGPVAVVAGRMLRELGPVSGIPGRTLRVSGPVAGVPGRTLRASGPVAGVPGQLQKGPRSHPGPTPGMMSDDSQARVPCVGKLPALSYCLMTKGLVHLEQEAIFSGKFLLFYVIVHMSGHSGAITVSMVTVGQESGSLENERRYEVMLLRARSAIFVLDAFARAGWRSAGVSRKRGADATSGLCISQGTVAQRRGQQE